MKIFDVKIEDKSRVEIFKNVKSILNSKKASKFTISTLNPEILLKAKENKGYKEILNSADLRTIDGSGVVLAAFLKKEKCGQRITGADLAEFIIEKSLESNLKIGLVVRKDGFSKSKEIIQAIEEKFCRRGGSNPPEKKFGGRHRSAYRRLCDEQTNVEAIEISLAEDFGEVDLKEIKEVEVLLVGLGAPFQERFIYLNKGRLKKLKLAIGVGGTFDFWTSKKRRAPLLMRQIGLEWLWRLMLQPNRASRIWRATGGFLGKVLWAQKIN